MQDARALQAGNATLAPVAFTEPQHGQTAEAIPRPPPDRDADEIGEADRDPLLAPGELEAVWQHLEPARAFTLRPVPHDCVVAHPCTVRRLLRNSLVPLPQSRCGFTRIVPYERRANVPPMASPIRVLIVDDHAVVRSGIRLLLEREPDIEPVGEAGTGREAVFQARALNPDVLLMDVVMPDQTGLEVLPTLLHEHPGAKILILSMQDDPRYVREAFAAGATGYVLKEAADTEVVAAVREVARGGQYVSPELGARLLAADADAERQAGDDPLSDREHEVLRLLALGHTNQEIAKQLYISVRTAETHRAHIMQKLHLQSRAELVRYALERNLLEN